MYDEQQIYAPIVTLYQVKVGRNETRTFIRNVRECYKDNIGRLFPFQFEIAAFRVFCHVGPYPYRPTTPDETFQLSSQTCNIYCLFLQLGYTKVFLFSLCERNSMNGGQGWPKTNKWKLPFIGKESRHKWNTYSCESRGSIILL